MGDFISTALILLVVANFVTKPLQMEQEKHAQPETVKAVYHSGTPSGK